MHRRVEADFMAIIVHACLTILGSVVPLYEGSSISTIASWYMMNQFAVSNRLSYKAMEDLIVLIKVV